MQSAVPNYLTFVPYSCVHRLFGLNKYLQQLDSLLESSIRPVVVTAQAASGKSALVLAYVAHYEYGRKFDNIAYVTMHKDSAMQFLYAFDSFKVESLDDLLLKLNNVHGRNLLVIDNVRTSEQAEFTKELASKLTWKLLLTSSRELDGYTKLVLDWNLHDIVLNIFDFFVHNDVYFSKAKSLVHKCEYNLHLAVLLAKLAELNLTGSDSSFYEVLQKCSASGQFDTKKCICSYLFARLNACQRKIIEFVNESDRIFVSIQSILAKLECSQSDFQNSFLNLVAQGILLADAKYTKLSEFCRFLPF